MLKPESDSAARMTILIDDKKQFYLRQQDKAWKEKHETSVLCPHNAVCLSSKEQILISLMHLK